MRILLALILVLVFANESFAKGGRCCGQREGFFSKLFHRGTKSSCGSSQAASSCGSTCNVSQCGGTCTNCNCTNQSKPVQLMPAPCNGPNCPVK